MLLLLKKTGQKSDADHALAWHPNFRIAEQLPDTKTVRTKFFVNIVAIAVALSLSLFVSLREFKIHALKAEHAGLELQISEVSKPSASSVATFKLFQAEEKVFNEAYAFGGGAFSFPDFLVHLGGVLPPGVTIIRVDFRGLATGITLTASAAGLDADTSDVVSSFVQKLQDDATVTRDFPLIKLTSLSRNVAEEQHRFEVSLAPKPVVKVDPKAAAKKAAKK